MKWTQGLKRHSLFTNSCQRYTLTDMYCRFHSLHLQPWINAASTVSWVERFHCFESVNHFKWHVALSHYFHCKPSCLSLSLCIRFLFGCSHKVEQSEQLVLRNWPQKSNYTDIASGSVCVASQWRKRSSSSFWDRRSQSTFLPNNETILPFASQSCFFYLWPSHNLNHVYNCNHDDEGPLTLRKYLF